jgi:hypothetical protein
MTTDLVLSSFSKKQTLPFNQAQDELISGNLGRYQELIELAEEYVALAIEELNK